MRGNLYSTAMPHSPDVIIVGGGLAGLAAARTLSAHGVSVLVLEREAMVGGRVATDLVDGFRIDRGFQVLLDSYPEAQRALDLASLDLRAFGSGALVRRGRGFGRVGDPWRDPFAALATLRSGAFSPLDAWRMLRLRGRALRAVDGAGIGTDGTPTMDRLRADGFSDAAIDRFFRPFFGGVFLDRALTSPADWFTFLFGMFATGSATLPAQGMGALPAQLAAGLPAEAVRCSTSVARLTDTGVTLADGEPIAAKAVVVATDAGTYATLLGRADGAVAWSGCATLSFDAPEAPIDVPLIALAGPQERGPIHHCCVPSLVAPTYAPAGRHLVSATVIGPVTPDDASLERAARTQLGEWFGATTVAGWRLLRVSRVPYSLVRAVRDEATAAALVRVAPGRYAAGDHLETPSINGALRNGRRAAEALLDDWGVTRRS